MMKPVDIVDVKAGINAGRLYVAVKGKYLLLGDHLTGEAVRLSDIEVKPVVHARWEDHHCTNCSQEAALLYECLGDDEGFAWYHSDFCPNCGARLDGEAHDAPG